MSRYVTTRGAARVARVPETVIRQWSARGQLVGHRVKVRDEAGVRIKKVYAVRDVLVQESRHRQNGGGSSAAAKRLSR